MIDVLLGAWAAGETKTFHVNGSYFEILECAYPIDVKLLGRDGNVRSDMRQAEASFFSEGLDFATIQITSARAQSIRSFYGDGTAGTRRTAGVVSVVDGGKARTLAGLSFISSSSFGPPAAGNIAQSAIYNPIGSKRRIVMNSISVSSSSSTGVIISFGSGVPSGGVLVPLSKNVGSAFVPNAQKYDTAVLAVTQGTSMIAVNLQAGVTTEIKLTEPIVIEPGIYLCMAATAPTAPFVCTTQFVEESIL